MTQFKFEGIIWFPDEMTPDVVDEDFMDLTAFYYGDKHQEFGLQVVKGTIKEIKK